MKKSSRKAFKQIKKTLGLKSNGTNSKKLKNVKI